MTFYSRQMENGPRGTFGCSSVPVDRQAGPFRLVSVPDKGLRVPPGHVWVPQCARCAPSGNIFGGFCARLGTTEASGADGVYYGGDFPSKLGGINYFQKLNPTENPNTLSSLQVIR